MIIRRIANTMVAMTAGVAMAKLLSARPEVTITMCSHGDEGVDLSDILDVEMDDDDDDIPPGEQLSPEEMRVWRNTIDDYASPGFLSRTLVWFRAFLIQTHAKRRVF